MTIEAVPGTAAARLLVASGEIDIVVVPQLLERLDGMLAGATAVVLDLSDVTFLDSSGLRLVDRMARACGGRGTPFRVAAPPGSAARRVLEIVEMTGCATDDRALAEAAVRAELAAQSPGEGVSDGSRPPAV